MKNLLGSNIKCLDMTMKSEEIPLSKEILRNSAVCMYYQTGILDQDINWFDNNNYRVIDMDTSNWPINIVFKKIMECFGFADWYGENLDAFDDYIDDLIDNKHKGCIIVFRHFDELVEQDKMVCTNLLDVIAQASRRWLVDGYHLICLIQSYDPDICFDKIGAIRPIWNGLEWFADKRKSN